MNCFLIAHIGHTTANHEHIQFYAPDARGYVICVEKAERYSEDEAKNACNGAQELIIVSEHEAQKIAKTTPYFVTNKGELRKLYDGDSHKPIPNNKESWKFLMNCRVRTKDRPLKPTPIRGSRAVYLDGVGLAVQQPLPATPPVHAA